MSAKNLRYIAGAGEPNFRPAVKELPSFVELLAPTRPKSRATWQRVDEAFEEWRKTLRFAVRGQTLEDQELEAALATDVGGALAKGLADAVSQSAAARQNLGLAMAAAVSEKGNLTLLLQRIMPALVEALLVQFKGLEALREPAEEETGMVELNFWMRSVSTGLYHRALGRTDKGGLAISFAEEGRPVPALALACRSESHDQRAFVFVADSAQGVPELLLSRPIEANSPYHLNLIRDAGSGKFRELLFAIEHDVPRLIIGDEEYDRPDLEWLIYQCPATEISRLTSIGGLVWLEPVIPVTIYPAVYAGVPSSGWREIVIDDRNGEAHIGFGATTFEPQIRCYAQDIRAGGYREVLIERNEENIPVAVVGDFWSAGG